MSTLKPGGRLLRPLDPTRLPADKLSRCMFTAIAWRDMNDEHRARWREWSAWAMSPESDLSNPKLGHAFPHGAKPDEADLAGAVLRDADMTGASLRGDKLSSPNLIRAMPVRADLEGAGQPGARRCVVAKLLGLHTHDRGRAQSPVSINCADRDL